MTYLSLIYQDETLWQKMPKAEAEGIYWENFGLADTIKKCGPYSGSNRPQPTHTATTVRVRNGKVSTTDRPSAETNERLGGDFLIEVMDLNGAVQVASRIPGARFGSIRVGGPYASLWQAFV